MDVRAWICDRQKLKTRGVYFYLYLILNGSKLVIGMYGAGGVEGHSYHIRASNQ